MKRLLISISVLQIILAIFFIPTSAIFSAESVAKLGKIVIGGKTNTEQYLLSMLLAIRLERAGFEVKQKVGLLTLKARQALLAGEIDVYWEYTGTAYKGFFKQSKRSVAIDAIKLFEEVKRRDQDNGIIWLERARLNNTFALAMKQSAAKKAGIVSISDLAAAYNSGKRFKIASTQEFYDRPDGFKPLSKLYAFEVPHEAFSFVASKATIGALQRGQVQVAMIFATNPEIISNNLKVLADDKQHFPVYNPAPNFRKEVLDKYPHIENIVNVIGPLLDDETIVNLNHDVDVNNVAIKDAARDWLRKNGLY